MVARLRAAGAIILGGTIMTEGGVTPLGWSAHFQGPYNVYNFDRYCGGSSSGSAVAVSSGLVPAAIGFDGGGSIRIPASMSGVHGLGVTFGRVPFDIGLCVHYLRSIPT
jgi:Asp-tRNA(Asn)/Glu-tRNA(Gln) amidotransferase A subunit family amidase